MPEELLRSSLFASFRKYILLMAEFQMAAMKSVQEKSIKDKALPGYIEITLNIYHQHHLLV